MCGTNMVFYKIEEDDTSQLSGKCLQRCSCLDTKYLEINGKCVQVYDQIIDTNAVSQANISENLKFSSKKFRLIFDGFVFLENSRF